MKTIKLFLLFFALAGCIATSARAQAFLTNGLVLYYPFNGNANDASGNGNDGIVQGAVLTTNRFGATNSAYAFDGVSSLIQIPQTIFGPTNAGVTISAWITTDNGPYTNTEFVVSKSSVNGEMEFFLASGQVYFGAKLANLQAYYTGAPMRSNSVMHIVGVYQQGQSVSVYVDGVLGSTMAIPNDTLYLDPPFPLDSAIGIYDYIYSPYDGFHGNVEDVRVYTRALSASEVQQLHAYEAGPVCVPHRATALAQVMNGFVVGATMTDGGCGYTNTPLVLIQGGGGTGATATAVVSNGVVVSITITAAGTGYSTTPTIYIYAPLGPQVGLVKAVKPVFSDLYPGTNYQLQTSTDLATWSNQGPPFSATNVIMSFSQYFDVGNWNQLFFRLQPAP